MDNIDKIFREFALGHTSNAPVIVCLCTGVAPFANSAPMPRQPEPKVGMPLDGAFDQHYCTALSVNPAIHDGAIMVARRDPKDLYRVVGWSYRLFPPDVHVPLIVNRGSAFNSSLAMSIVPGVDRVFLVTAYSATRFARGKVYEL